MNHPLGHTSLLIVDDESSIVESLVRIFERGPYHIRTASNGREALAKFQEAPATVVITDFMMPEMTGRELLSHIKQSHPTTQVILMTAHGTVEAAVDAIKEGAFDFVEKPLKKVDIQKSVQSANERFKLIVENKSLKEEIKHLKHKTIVGTSHLLRESLDMLEQAAKSSATILLLGESGTGKELLAREAHSRSGRDGEFIAVNLSALPETIVEAELFGYERGAFTGAVSKKEGRIAQAKNGTLFLDEIGELPPGVQVKLLRVLQENEFEPLGGKTQSSTCRIIAATHRDLKALVSEGKFREDLYYRLDVISIAAPPLRARKSDIPLLASHFLSLYALRNQKQGLVLDPSALDLLCAYDWPGNIRELENVIERAVVLSKSSMIMGQDLPPKLRAASTHPQSITFELGTALGEMEREAIDLTLKHTHGDKQMAAKMLGISYRTIYRRLGEKDPSEKDLVAKRPSESDT